MVLVTLCVTHVQYFEDVDNGSVFYLGKITEELSITQFAKHKLFEIQQDKVEEVVAGRNLLFVRDWKGSCFVFNESIKYVRLPYDSVKAVKFIGNVLYFVDWQGSKNKLTEVVVDCCNRYTRSNRANVYNMNVTGYKLQIKETPYFGSGLVMMMNNDHVIEGCGELKVSDKLRQNFGETAEEKMNRYRSPCNSGYSNNKKDKFDKECQDMSSLIKETSNNSSWKDLKKHKLFSMLNNSRSRDKDRDRIVKSVSPTKSLSVKVNAESAWDLVASAKSKGCGRSNTGQGDGEGSRLSESSFVLHHRDTCSKTTIDPDKSIEPLQISRVQTSCKSLHLQYRASSEVELKVLVGCMQKEQKKLEDKVRSEECDVDDKSGHKETVLEVEHFAVEINRSNKSEVAAKEVQELNKVYQTNMTIVKQESKMDYKMATNNFSLSMPVQNMTVELAQKETKVQVEVGRNKESVDSLSLAKELVLCEDKTQKLDASTSNDGSKSSGTNQHGVNNNNNNKDKSNLYVRKPIKSRTQFSLAKESYCRTQGDKNTGQSNSPVKLTSHNGTPGKSSGNINVKIDVAVRDDRNKSLDISEIQHDESITLINLPSQDETCLFPKEKCYRSNQNFSPQRFLTANEPENDVYLMVRIKEMLLCLANE